jgi:hypothetical protein
MRVEDQHETAADVDLLNEADLVFESGRGSDDAGAVFIGLQGVAGPQVEWLRGGPRAVGDRGSDDVGALFISLKGVTSPRSRFWAATAGLA